MNSKEHPEEFVIIINPEETGLQEGKAPVESQVST